MKNKIILLIIIVVLVLAGLAFWYFQRNAFSKDVLKLEILGPDTIEAGQKVDYILKYKNNGEITLTNAKVIFEYPEYSLVEIGKLRQEFQLEDIYPGKEQTMDFSARVFGQENEAKKAQAWLEFQPKNLKARYEVSTSQSAMIKFSPLTFEFDIPSKIETEKDFSFSLNYFSNIDYPLSQLRVKIDYPANFEFSQSQPKAMDEAEWQLPLLNKAQGGRIVITGRFNSGVGEQKIFKATLGMWQDNQLVALKETTKGVEMIKPMIYLSQLVNGSSDYIPNPGDVLHYEIFFKNIGQSSFENLFLVVGLEGSLFDLESLRAPGANYHQGDSSLVWDWKTNSQLRLLAEDDEGKLEFWINLKNELPQSMTSENLIIKDTVNVAPAKEEFSLKVNSKLVLEQRAYFDDEVFGNTGSLPPTVDQPMTFTIIWKLKNFYNDLRDVKVRTVLPSGVALTGQLFPREAKFAFDSQSREIIWDAGDIPASQGLTNEAPNFSFQVSVTPQSSQRGQAAGLVSSAKASGEDTWTQEIIEASADAVNTGILSDTGFISSKGIVQ
jgi:hypothetical protein